MRPRLAPVALLALAFTASAEQVARADSAGTEAPGQRNLGVIVSAGLSDGIAGGIRAGHSRLGVEVVGGAAPVLAIYQRASGFPALKFLASGQFSAALYGFFWKPSSRADVGATLGYRYNSLLLHGAGGGLYVHYDLRHDFAARIVLGASYFPSGAERVEAAANVPAGPLTNVQFGANFGIVWFP